VTRRPPKLAVALLRVLAPLEERDPILGDLEEEFGTANRSNLWYWRQAMRSSVSLSIRSLGQSCLAVLSGAGAMVVAVALIEMGARYLLPDIGRARPAVFAFTLLLLGIGVACGVAGGWLASRLADRGSLVPALAAAMLAVAIAALWVVRGYGVSAPLWFRGGLVLLVVPAVMYGRHIRVRRPAPA